MMAMIVIVMVVAMIVVVIVAMILVVIVIVSVILMVMPAIVILVVVMMIVMPAIMVVIIIRVVVVPILVMVVMMTVPVVVPPPHPGGVVIEKAGIRRRRKIGHVDTDGVDGTQDLQCGQRVLQSHCGGAAQRMRPSEQPRIFIVEPGQNGPFIGTQLALIHMGADDARFGLGGAEKSPALIQRKPAHIAIFHDRLRPLPERSQALCDDRVVRTKRRTAGESGS